MKKCTDCKKDKRLDEYNHRPNYNNSGVIYYKSRCKECEVKRVQCYQAKNPDKVKEYQKDYYNKNKEVILKRLNIWNKKNREWVNERARKYYWKRKAIR